MSRRGGGCLVAAALALSLAVLVLGGSLLYLVSTQGGASAPAATGAGDEAARSFEDYGWAELSEISAQIAATGGGDAAREVAASHGIAVGDSRAVTLDDGTTVVVRVVGLCQDERADGGGPAGITLLATPLTSRAMAADSANEGGWEASDLRAWLATDGLSLLPDDLAALVVPVSKLTASAAVEYGSADVSGAVGATADALWVPSVSEVCGPVTWMTDEYGTVPSASTENVSFAPYDELLSSEGEQYEYFASQGASGSSGPVPCLEMTLGGEPRAWWLRTSYPFTYSASTERLCYQVMASGMPGALAQASSEAGVAVGLCI